MLQRDISQLRSDIQGVVALIKRVPEFFRERVTLQRAEEQIRRDLDRREERFLGVVRTGIYERPKSPYLKLLRLAGCEYADVQAQVRRSGVEATLKRLAREGVYLTSDEFKGKKEVNRGRHCFRVVPHYFDRPTASAGYQTQSSGTTNQPIRSFVSLDLLSIRTPATCVAFAAHDLLSRAHAMYDSVLPGSAGINNLMIYARMGVLTDRWFARPMPIRSKLERIYHSCTTQLLVKAARLCGAGFPKPEYLHQEVDKILHWVAAQKVQTRSCCITTAASNAARIARAACRLGISLESTKFIVGGEPFTDSKRQVIESAGATAISRYAYGGSVNIGFGCANSLYADEIHVNQHLLALITHPRSVGNGGDDICPLLCTTLDPLFPRLLLNVESGDYGYLTQRNCGCALEKAGLTLHLHHIRSFEKFTSEGMNYFYGDLYELFEKILPAEFGGSPGDYQLVEEEDGNAQNRLTLVVDPEIGEIDEKAIVDRLRTAFSSGTRSNRFMTGVWEKAETFRVRREIPYASPRGKILPLHIRQHQSSSLQ
ncbi:MAG: hypothetical protein WD688_02955 [Candidatus Binatia bacterium]